MQHAVPGVEDPRLVALGHRQGSEPPRVEGERPDRAPCRSRRRSPARARGRGRSPRTTARGSPRSGRRAAGAGSARAPRPAGGPRPRSRRRSRSGRGRGPRGRPRTRPGSCRSTGSAVRSGDGSAGPAGRNPRGRGASSTAARARSAVDDADEIARDLEVRRGRPVEPRLGPPERAPGRPVERLHDPVGGERDDAPAPERQALAAAPVDRVGQRRRPQNGPGGERARLEPLAERDQHAVAVEPEAHQTRVRPRHAVEREIPARLVRRRQADPGEVHARRARLPRARADRLGDRLGVLLAQDDGAVGERQDRAPRDPPAVEEERPELRHLEERLGRARTRRRPPGGSAGRSRPRSPPRSRGRGDGAGGGATGRPGFPRLRC